MKNLLTLACFMAILFVACTDKKNAESTSNTIDESTIQKIENQTDELKSLEDEIENDLNELDDLLKEVDEN